MKRFLTAILALLALGLILIPVQLFAESVSVTGGTGTATLTATDKGTFTSGDGGIKVIEFTVDCLDLEGYLYDVLTTVTIPIYLDKPYRVIGVDWIPGTGSAGGASGDLTEVPDDNGDIEIRSTITSFDILNGAGDNVPASTTDGDEFFRLPADSKSSGYIITRIDEGLYFVPSNLNNVNTNAKGNYYLYLQQL